MSDPKSNLAELTDLANQAGAEGGVLVLIRFPSDGGEPGIESR